MWNHPKYDATDIPSMKMMKRLVLSNRGIQQNGEPGW